MSVAIGGNPNAAHESVLDAPHQLLNMHAAAQPEILMQFGDHPDGDDEAQSRQDGLIRRETMRRLHETSTRGTQALPRTSLEQFDTFSKVTALIMRNQDVSDWTVEDVATWLKANPQFDAYASRFESNEIDGYSLLSLTEEDMVETLGMVQEGERDQLKRAIKKLIVVWIRYGKNCESFFREQADSLYFDELSLVEQSMDESAGNFSIVKMLERGNNSSMMHNPAASGGDPKNDQDAIDEAEKSRLLQTTAQGRAIVSKADHLAALLSQEGEEDNLVDEAAFDPTEDIYIKTLSSFKFLINYAELKFNPERDLIQKAGTHNQWCSLYQASWLGQKVCFREFSAKNTLHSHERIMNFLKELEVAHSLRHPNIVLYMGLSLDPVKNNALIVHEYVSKATLFDIIHGVVPRRRPQSNALASGAGAEQDSSQVSSSGP